MNPQERLQAVLEIRNPQLKAERLSAEKAIIETLAKVGTIKGDTGPEGPMGPMGPEGPQGMQGIVGPRGMKGEDGNDGKQGPAGPQGPTGATGATGPMGPIGPSGSSPDIKELINSTVFELRKEPIHLKDIKGTKELIEFLKLGGFRGGGSGGSSISLQTDGTPNTSQTVLNLIEGTNITLTPDGAGGVTIDATISGGGITRSINSISSPTTAGATASIDYVYLVSGTTTLTLPTAVGNTNRYTVKNVGSGDVTVDTTSAQTIDGGATAILTASLQGSIDLISDGANWNVI